MAEEQRNGNSKQQHAPITFSFLFSEPQNNNNNNPSSSSSVLDVTHDDDDRVCLHFSLGDPSCSSCHHQQQQQLITDKKRLTLKNKKTRIIIKQQHKPTTMLFSSLFKTEEQHNNNNPSSSVVTHQDDVTDDDRCCLHFSVGHSSCPSCDHQQQPITDKKRKRPQQQQLTFKNKKARINNWVWDDHHDDPVGGRPRNWGYSTAMLLYDDPWKIKKVLTQSDLGNNCNILIERELANDLIVPVLGGRHICENRDVPVPVWDSDTESHHSLVFTIRPSNNSHVFKDTWVKEFVIRRNLQVGNEIGLIWDRYNQQFIFSVIRAYRGF